MGRNIMVVDDEKMITSTLSTLIKMLLKYQVTTYNDPTKALTCEGLRNNSIDLIISDFMMPGMNGLEFLKNAKDLSPNSVAIMLTGYADKENAIRSINEIGIYYYMEKPWDNNQLIRIIQNGLEKKQLTDDLKTQNREVNRLYELLKHDYQQEVDNVMNLVISLSNTIEARDEYTDGHTRRVGAISRALAQELGMKGKKLDAIEIAGIIHDIGKIGVADNILNKPGKLTDEEYAMMKKHSVIGEKIIKPLNSLTEMAEPVRHHHEKLNGAGYPDGLAGDEISLESRILAVADVFDALNSDRPYRSRMPMEQIVSILRQEADGGALDPEITRILFRLIDAGEIDRIVS